MKKNQSLHLSAPLLLIFLLINLYSCHKACSGCGMDYPPPGRTDNLIAYTWGLTSAKSINSLSSGILHNYKGQPADSLHIEWGLSPNLLLSATCSFIQKATGDSTVSPIVFFDYASGFKISDTSTIAYDTIITSAPWRPTYSDTLFITKVSPTQLVFKVGYNDAGGRGYEIDSFRNVGYYRPF